MICTKEIMQDHLPVDKMAAIPQRSFSSTFSWMKKFWILIRISPKFVFKGPIDNKSALVQVMAWCRTGDKPLLEMILIQFTDAYWRH